MIETYKIVEELETWKHYQDVCSELNFQYLPSAHNDIVAAKVNLLNKVLYGNNGHLMTDEQVQKLLDINKSVYDGLTKIAFDKLDEEMFYVARANIHTLCFVLGIDFTSFMDVKNVEDPCGFGDIVGVKTNIE